MGGGGVLHQQKPFLQQEVLVPRARSIRGSDGIGHTAGAHSCAPLRPDWDWHAKLLSGSAAEVSQAPPATRAALPFLSSPVLPKRDPVPACVILTKSLSWAIGPSGLLGSEAFGEDRSRTFLGTKVDARL